MNKLASNFFIKSLGGFLTYIIILLNGRFIDSVKIGEIILGISYINILLSFSTLGYPELVVRNITTEYAIDKSNFFRNLISIQFLLVAFIFIIISFFINISLIYLLFTFFVIAGTYFSNKIKNRDFIRLYNILTSIIIPLTQFFLLLLYISFYKFSVKEYLLLLYIPFFIITYIFEKHTKSQNPDFIKSSRKYGLFTNNNHYYSFLTSSILLGISALICRLNVNIDIIMVGNILNKDQVYFYKIHSIVTTISLLFTVTYNIQIHNNLSRYVASKQLTKIRSLLITGFKLNFLYNIIVSIGVFFILPYLTFYFSSGSYTLSIQLLLLLLITGFVFGSVQTIIVVNIQLKMERYIVLFNFIALIVNIILNFILIPQIGLIGAVLSTLTGALVSFILCTYILFLKLKTYK